MRLFFICAALAATTLTGCSKYQFVTLNSNLPHTKTGFPDIENDTLAIRYSFAGANGPTQVEVFNKLSVPLVVECNSVILMRNTWPKSYDRLAIAAANPDFPFLSVAENPDYLSRANEPQTLFIAPRSAVSFPTFSLYSKFFKLSTPDMVNKQLNGDVIRVQFFGKEASPLKFIHTISYATGATVSENTMRVSQEFWVDEVFVTMTRPEYVHEYKGRGDKFYIRKGSGLGIFLASIGFCTYFAVSQATD